MEIICLDTDILIEHKRAKDKTKTKFFELSTQYQFAVSIIVAYELFRGDNSEEDKFWNEFFSQRIMVLNIDFDCAKVAGNIYRDLKQKGKMIGVEDILIAATAIRNGYKLATENKEHFARIPNLILV